jgi:hypothetical protein
MCGARWRFLSPFYCTEIHLKFKTASDALLLKPDLSLNGAAT